MFYSFPSVTGLYCFFSQCKILDLVIIAAICLKKLLVFMRSGCENVQNLHFLFSKRVCLH